MNIFSATGIDNITAQDQAFDKVNRGFSAANGAAGKNNGGNAGRNLSKVIKCY